MKITSVAGSPYGDYEDQILILFVKLDEGEVVHVGDMISIEMMDDTFWEREVKIIDPKCISDFGVISEQASAYGKSKKTVMKAEGPCDAEFVVLDVPYHEVKTEEEIMAREAMSMWENKICLTPYKELDLGEESIYDHVQDGYTVPLRVITYLQTTEPFFMSPGIYDHPFKSGCRLLGPYTYTDGKYYWDRDAWKYVVKYHVTLPQEFIDHVMSEDGEAYLDQLTKENNSWAKSIEDLKNRSNTICLLPDDAGDIALENF